MELAGKPNIANYFSILCLIDPQGARRRMKIYYGNLIKILEGIINEQVLRTSLEVSMARNNLLDSFLNLVEEDNLELSCHDFKHMLLVIEN